MKHILSIFLFIILSQSYAQNFANKEYYLVDSLVLEELSDADKELLENALKKYHSAENDISKINALSIICENMMSNEWYKYQFYQYNFIKKRYNSKSPKQLKIALGNALNNIGFIYNSQGESTVAIKNYQEALEIQKEIRDQGGEANSLNNIGLIYYDRGEVSDALTYLKKALKIQKRINDKSGIAYSLNNIGYIHNSQGEISEALEYYLKALKIQEKIKDKIGIAQSLNNIGVVYDDQGNIPKALEYHLRSLKIKEEIGDDNGIAYSLNNIGIIYESQKNNLKAIEYYEKSLKIREKIGDKKGISHSLSNIGVIYDKQGDLNKALNFYKKALQIRREIGDENGVAKSLNNIGVIYFEKDSISLAIENYHKSLAIRIKIGDKSGIIQSLNNIGNLQLKIGDFSYAKDVGEKSMKLAKEIGYPESIKRNANLLSKVYEKQGKGLKALEMYKIYITMQDSLNNKENQKATIQQQAKYEYEKQKALDDAENDKLIAIEKEEKAKQQIITYATAVGLGLVILFLFFVFNRLQVTKKQKLVIEDQKYQVEQQKEVVELAHHELEEKNKEIMDSITYAKRIQNAILPPTKVVKEFLSESFILYKPKDIVAGDFYWMESVSNNTSLRGTKQSAKKDEIASLHKSSIRNDGNVVLFAAADCTGHGVPGAMVSVVCNNALNRSVREHGLTDPGEILNKTREIVIQEFEKSDEDVQDGMDIALCSLNGNTLKYAGAHNPLWIIRNSSDDSESPDEFQLLETKANKQPIGKYDNLEPYTTHTFELQKGDSIYIFSDGFVDQFGGKKGKKFKAKAFRELLLSIQNKTMEEQKSIIDTTFKKWKGNLEQVDDVCVIGVKV